MAPILLILLAFLITFVYLIEAVTAGCSLTLSRAASSFFCSTQAPFSMTDFTRRTNGLQTNYHRLCWTQDWHFSFNQIWNWLFHWLRFNSSMQSRLPRLGPYPITLVNNNIFATLNFFTWKNYRLKHEQTTQPNHT